MARKVLLLFPEDIPADADVSLPGPSYAEVTGRARSGLVPVRTIANSQTTGRVSLRVPISVTRRRAVDVDELEVGGAPGLLLRRPVVVVSNEPNLYGQVIAYADEMVTVRHARGEMEVHYSAVAEVAPVVVFLLYRTERVTTTQDEHETILDRLLGSDSESATRSIPRLLQGLVPASAHPRRSDRLLWQCPVSGVEKQVTVGNVIDFGYFKDGDQTIPRAVKLGTTYADDPTSNYGTADAAAPEVRETARQRTKPTTRSPKTALSTSDQRFADLLDELDVESGDDDDQGRGFSVGQKRPHSMAARAIGEVEPARHVRLRSAEVAEADATGTLSAAAAATLAKHPELQAYVSSLQTRRPPQSPPMYTSISDLAPLVDLSSSKDSFRPPTASRLVHERITSVQHKGKQVMAFLFDARLSKATKFLPRPVFLIHLYDFQFGEYALSIFHLQRVQDRLRTQGANKSAALAMRNFSTSLALPDYVEPTSLNDLIDALRVLCQYATEFYDSVTRQLVEAASDFALELKDFEPLSGPDVIAIGEWYGRLFAEYRRAVDADIQNGSDTRTLVRNRLTMNDAALNVTLLKAARQASSGPPQQGPRRSQFQEDGGQSSRYQSRSKDSNRSMSTSVSVPPHIARRAPRQGQKALCLRSISEDKCRSTIPGQCKYSYLAHFIPNEPLDPSVRAFVEENLGGIRTDLRHRL